MARLLFIDVLRIVGIGLVVFSHIMSSNLYPVLSQFDIESWLSPYSFQYYPYLWITWGRIGIGIFILASGCSLAYNHPSMPSWQSVENFYKKRFLRIYPIYWVTLFLTIALQPWLLNQSFSSVDVLKLTTGFQALGARNGEETMGLVNGMLWFLTPLLALYILFPIVIYCINKRPKISLLSFFLVGEVGTWAILSYTTKPAWSPLYWIFIFGLGVYLVKRGYYPKTANNNALIIFLSSIAFYVYLINSPMNNLLLSNLYVFFPALLLYSTMLFALDKQILQRIALALPTKVGGYIRQNWGVPFILGFISLLMVASVSLSLGWSNIADTADDYAFWALVIGVALQFICFLRSNKRSGGD